MNMYVTANLLTYWTNTRKPVRKDEQGEKVSHYNTPEVARTMDHHACKILNHEDLKHQFTLLIRKTERKKGCPIRVQFRQEVRLDILDPTLL